MFPQSHMPSSPTRSKTSKRHRSSLSDIVPVVAPLTLEQLPVFHIESSNTSGAAAKQDVDGGEIHHDWNDVKSRINNKLGSATSMKATRLNSSTTTYTGSRLGRVRSINKAADLSNQIEEMRSEQLQRKKVREKLKRSRTRRNLEIESLKDHTKLYNVTHTVIHPEWASKRIWDYVVLLLVFYTSIQIPMLLAFPDLVEYNFISYTVDGIFIIDFFLCFRTAYLKPDYTYEIEPAEIFKQYMRTWFWFDAPACLPIDMFVPRGSRELEMVSRALKLPRVMRLAKLFKFLNKLSKFQYANTVKIMKFIFMIMLVAHWTGCLFFFLMHMENQFGYGTWMEDNWGLIVEGDDIGNRYIILFYTAFLMLLGEGIGPVTGLEKLYATLALLIGTIVTAVIVGNVSFVVSNQNSLKYQHQSRIDRITDEMRALNIPQKLLQRTLDYYDYLWRRHRTFDPRQLRFVSELSPTLQKEILLHLNREVILNCDFFREVSNRCILRLLFSFQSAVYIHDDFIAEEGEMAEALILMTHGTASVVRGESLMPLSLLHPGDYFGEKALLLDHRNATSVIAQTNCDTRVLHKNEFKEIVKEFPELREAILKQSEHLDVSEYDTHMQRHRNLRTASRRKLHLHETHLKHTSSSSVESGEGKSSIGSRIDEHIDTISELNDKFEQRFQDISKSQMVLSTQMGQLFRLISSNNGLSSKTERKPKLPSRTKSSIRREQKGEEEESEALAMDAAATTATTATAGRDDTNAPPPGSPPLPDMDQRRSERHIGRAHGKITL